MSVEVTQLLATPSDQHQQREPAQYQAVLAQQQAAQEAPALYRVAQEDQVGQATQGPVVSLALDPKNIIVVDFAQVVQVADALNQQPQVAARGNVQFIHPQLAAQPLLLNVPAYKPWSTQPQYHLCFSISDVQNH